MTPIGILGLGGMSTSNDGLVATFTPGFSHVLGLKLPATLLDLHSDLAALLLARLASRTADPTALLKSGDRPSRLGLSRLLVDNEFSFHSFQYSGAIPTKAFVHPAEVSQRQPFTFALRLNHESGNVG